MAPQPPRPNLETAAAASMPSADAYGVSLTALPFLKARQDRQRQWLMSRPDRFCQLLAKIYSSDFVGDRLMLKGALSEAEHEELLALAPDASASLRAEQLTRSSELRAVLEQFNPFAVIGHFSFNQVFGFWGSYHEPSHEGSEVVVEVVAGLYLSQSSSYSEQLPGPDEIASIEELTRELVEICHLYNSASRLPRVDADRLSAQTSSQWMHVRGDSYEHHARDITRAIYRPVDHLMRKEYGFTIDEFYEVADSVRSLIEIGVNSFTEHLARELFEDPNVEPSADAQTRAQEELLERVMQEVPRLLTVTPQNIASHGSLDETNVKAVLQILSTSVGQLEQSAYSGPFDESPLFLHPFVEHNGDYELPVPGHLVRSPYALFERQLLKSHPAFARHRAHVLDEMAIGLLSEALPGSWNQSNLYYEFDDGEGLQRYETDGLVLFEGRCLVVEGKAGSISVAARRGDLVRAQRDLGRTLQEAWEQSARVSRYLRSVEHARFNNKTGAEVLTIRAADIKQLFFINPTLHPLGAYAFDMPSLRALGLFKGEAAPWPVFITDLRVIVEMVQTPAELLHFIDWRMSLPIGDRIVVFDELDVFGSYLFGQVGREPKENERMMLGSSTVDFDAFYAGELGQGPPTERPHRVLGDLLETHLNHLAQVRPPRWLEQSFAILDLSLTEAAAVSGWFETVAYREIGNSKWIGAQFGDTFLVALANDVTLVEVLLDVALSTPRTERRLVAHLTNDGPAIDLAERLRAPERHWP
jgi:hypothetical protein